MLGISEKEYKLFIFIIKNEIHFWQEERAIEKYHVLI